ncbi:AAA-like domain-containing protein [Sphingomonas sp. LB3N6]|uniref:AAA-like domain-containing protein n=1 Tax=Sphingomonas fucosidasi TaxID=3096164 RepID=UPI002FC5D979
MSAPRLPSVAIIPDSLYVERAADRQLASIIAEMGRPGYVLDPRQMGKTNLLLHARRKLGSDKLRFVYADLSLRSKSAPAFYRRLLELATAAHPDLFAGEETATALAELRDTGHGDPSGVFERTLVRILDGWDGRLVLILDEVDGLTGRTFSDAVFAHIRSLYFAREDTPSLARLTFVLAGVAEPSQLITDKSISPFNIGQKIFLRDFTTDQVAQFLQKAALSFSPTVIDRIMHWTSGNPRLTWDLAAELDMVELGGEPIALDVVDDAVDRLFLTSFDRPPIDHVRTLVSSERDLRLGVLALRDGRDLSDRQRSLLHLAGIATQVPGDRQPEFRNRIIDRAISGRWLQELETAARHHLVSAQFAFRELDFHEAVLAYGRFLEGRQWTREERQDVLKLGIAQFEIGAFDAALRSFETFGNLGGATREPSVLLWTARTRKALGSYILAEQDYQAALRSLPTPVERMRIFLGLAQLAAISPARLGEAVDLGRKALASLDAARAVNPAAKLDRYELQAVELLASLSDGSVRGDYLERALRLQGETPSLATATMLASEGDGRRYSPVLRRAFVTTDLKRRSVRELGAAALTIRAFEGREGLREAVGELARNAGVEPGVVWSLAFDGLARAGEKADMEVLARDILDEGLVGAVRVALALQVGRTVLLHKGKSSWDLADRYLEIMGRGDEALTRNDHLTLLSIAADGNENGGSELNERLIAAASALEKPTDPRLRQSFLLVRYVQVVAALRAEDHETAQTLALDGMMLVEETTAAPERDLPIDLVAQISEFLSKVTSVRSVRPPHRSHYRHLGRNDQVTVVYRDGTRTTGKFKALQADLEQGACVLVENEPAP